MHEVNVGRKSLADYRSILSEELIAQIEGLAADLRGCRVLHLNATAFGGGVAEILETLIPLVNDVGLEAEWRVISAPPEFFTVTKSFHNGLQGHRTELSPEGRELYEEVCRANAAELTESYDVVVVHDPQPLMIRESVADAVANAARWVWRCHIDTSTPDPNLSAYLLPSINRYDAAVYTLREYVPAGLSIPLWEVAPTIDPLSVKNLQLSPSDAAYVVGKFGIDVRRPLLLQVSRFDPWKDPLGVVDAYRMVKEQHPGVQLALVGSMASDDPEGWDELARLTDYVGDDPDVFVLSNIDRIGPLEVNAFQGHADIVLQKSLREGFGLTVTEALWKARPTIGGRVGGIPLQIDDGVTGYLVDSVEQCAQRCLEILAAPQEHQRMALLGKEHIRREFLTPRLLRDDLLLFSELLAGKLTGER